MLRRINVQSLNKQSGRGLKRLLSYPKDTVGVVPLFGRPWHLGTPLSTILELVAAQS